MPQLDAMQNMDNIADSLSKEELTRIGERVLKGFHIDKLSRTEWESTMQESLEIIKQIYEIKSRGSLSVAANIKFPLLAKGCIDFAARTYPEIIKNGKVLYSKILGSDPQGDKLARSLRVMDYMNYQFLFDIPDWEEGVDSLLTMLPVLGTCFKKTYYDPIDDKVVSMVVDGASIVVNRKIKSLDSARRISHILSLYKNDIITRQRKGLFRDFECEYADLQAVSVKSQQLLVDQDSNSVDILDDDRPIELIEQHCWLDLDDDGYEEPYIVTIDAVSGYVYRIFNRFDKIERKDGKIIRILAENCFIDFHYIKNPDGGFYSLGLGVLLFPINKSINTIINQLIDAGTLANLPSGIISSQVRFNKGAFKIAAGEYKVVETNMGATIKDNIYPLPVNEPSPTLFNLLELLIGVAKDMASINDVMQGKQAVTNVPATTMMTLIEQGMKVLNSITKRVLVGFGKEYKRVFKLNQKYLKDNYYANVLDQPYVVASVDFNSDNCDVFPVADPDMSSDAQRITRARAVMELSLQMPGIIKPELAAVHSLEALQFDASEISQLITPPDPNAPPPPDSQEQLAHAQLYLAQAKAAEAGIMLEQNSAVMDGRRNAAVEAETLARIDKMRSDSAINAAKEENVRTKLHQENVNNIANNMQSDAKLAIEKDKISADLNKELIKSGTQRDVANSRTRTS